MSKHIDITAESFEKEVLQSPVPVLLDFWAPWCGPCRIIGPVVEQLAEEYSDCLKVGKICVDDEADLASQHGVASIPALFVYKDGKIVNQSAGALPKPNIEALFKDYI